jgi:hypothetical protein
MSGAIKQKQQVRTTAVKDSICKVDVPAVTFQQLWSHYVTGNPHDDPAYDNQCAIRLSATLHSVGIEMKSFSQALVKPGPGKTSIGRILLDGKATATRADEMAAWLKLQPFCGLPAQPENITGADWEVKVRGRTGIIFFGGYWQRDGEVAGQGSGGHIDLWNGQGMTGFGSGFRARWNIVITGIWSDLNAAKIILFFPVK